MDAFIKVNGGLGRYIGSHSTGGIPVCKEDEYEQSGGECRGREKDENKEK